MGQNTTKWVTGKLWRDRAEEMLAVAETVGEETRAVMEETRGLMEETRALMERLAVNWLLIAAVEDERPRPAHDDFRSADSRPENDGGV
jgi:hypothetical protein